MTDKVVAITSWEIDKIVDKGVKREKIIVIKNGTSKIFFEKIRPNRFREKHGIKGKIVLFFGRLSKVKGPDVLAEVGKELVKDIKDVNFVFIGPDEGMKDKVEEVISGVERMYLFDPIFDKKEIAEMYQAADLFCLPSYREGSPLALFEAMASGLPVVGPDVMGIPYEVKEGVNGFLVKYGDKAGLKKAILKILEDEGLAKQMSENNKRTAKDYDWDIIAEKYMGVYKSLVNKKD